MFGGMFRRKSLDAILAAAERPNASLRRSLGAFNVTMLGIGGIIGAGIFATIGTAAAGDAVRLGAGPSLTLSFVITAIVCAFTALCYAEFASMVPISGSAYTYAYSTLGEIIAWIIGWDLILEYAIGNVAVAVSWGGYFDALLHNTVYQISWIKESGWRIPEWLTRNYRTAAQEPGFFDKCPHVFGIPIVFNIYAFTIVMTLTAILVWGIRESARFNVVMVTIKIVVLAIFVGAALYFVSPSEMTQNWTPFQPNGWTGTFAGAAVIFFAYIGFDAVSTVAEETRRPSRDLPIGIIASLIICTVIYIIVAAVFTGMMSYEELSKRSASELAESLTMALGHVAPHATGISAVVAFGSVVAHTAVLLVFQMGQPRIFFSMARDGLLPQTFAKVHPRFKTPYVTTIVTGVIVGIISSLASIDEMVDLTNIGTLFAFTLVCIGIPILRYKDPHRPRPFKVPFGPFLLPLLGAASAVGLMFYLPPASWWRFVGWLTLGLVVYTSYGYCHSAIGREQGRPARTPLWLKIVSLGLFTLAIGLFVVPHNAGLSDLISSAFARGAERNLRAFWGVSLIGSGTGLAVLMLALRPRRP